jgi:16S rRNA (cytosine967-C5)-methyltransferase
LEEKSLLSIIYARDIIHEIIQHETSFTDAVKKVTQGADLDSATHGLIRSLTSCELHHHAMLDHVVNEFFPNLTLQEKLLLQVATGNLVFIKRLPETDVVNFLTETLQGFNIDMTLIQTFFERLKSGKRLIREDIKEQTPLFLSLKYNTPLWLVEMWIKHFNFSTTVKILQSNGKPVMQACRINTDRVTTEEVLAKDSEFVAGPIPDTVIYKGKEPLKNRPVFMDHWVFQQRLAVTDIINQISFDNILGEVLIVEGRTNALYLELPLVTKDAVPINIATNSIERKLMMQKTIKHSNLKNITIFESTPSGLISHVSNQQDFVLVIPNCSKFDLIRSLPDFFIHFKQSELDDYIKEQTAAMEESSRFVVEGGLLVYGVNTINHKEGTYLVQEFIRKHPEFKLILEKQYLPFDEFNTALYVAALRKKN